MKEELRQRLRRILATLTPEEIQRRSATACGLLVAQPEYHRAEILMVYLSMATEMDTTPLVLRAWEDRKRVVAPKVSWNERRMLPIEIRSLTADVGTSEMGIREPVAGQPIPVADIDLVVVPGLGFDPLGNRLGRGRGFFDRFLALDDCHATSCGLAFEVQVVDSVPTGPFDVQMAMLVTDQRVRRFGTSSPHSLSR